MTIREEEVIPGIRGIVLESEQLSTTVLPDKGCDIYAFVDRESGIDLLFKSPWGLRRPGPGSRAPDSMAHWMEHYAGGWQVLLPNGGAASIQQGVEWGFHGEACLLPWSIEDAGDVEVRLTVKLFRAPLLVERRLRMEGSTLRLAESVTNESPGSLEVMWVHHPAFGPPFLESGCVLQTGARVFRADDEAPGTVFEPDSVHNWPEATAADGQKLDLSAIPGPRETRSQLGYLTDFQDGFFSLTNPRLQLGFRLDWPLAIFPRAWFWQEVHAMEGFPWHRRAYVTAVEPATTIPAQGLGTSKEKGGAGLVLKGGERRGVELKATLYRGENALNRIER